MIQDISGKWKFSEEFECGMDNGFAHFTQNGSVITGYLEYVEKIEDQEPFDVIQEVTGEIIGHHLKLQGTTATSKDGSKINDYNLDTLEGTLTHQGKIVGHSFDSEDICGVFVLTRD
ncbi:MAG: hypothetical protein AB9846_04905 [Tenuifilaceae bacterium]